MFSNPTLWMQRLDPRTKLLITLVVLIALFNTTWAGTVILLLWALLAWFISGKTEGVTPLPRSVLILALVALGTHVWWGPAPYLPITWIHLSESGLARGVLLAVRLVVMTLAARSLTQTTSPLALSDALRWLLSPLEYLGLAVPDLSMLLAIGSRFLPELQADVRRLTVLRRLRHTGLVKGHKESLPQALRQTGREVLIPLFRLSLRRAHTLGDALALRGYAPGRRACLPHYCPGINDLLAWVVTLCFISLSLILS